MPAEFRAWDDYFIPGTTVLRNKFDETDPEKLSLREQAVTALRMEDLARHPISGSFDYDHMKAIHGYIFQDVYEWAGKERIGPDGRMTKEGPDVVNFAPGDPNADRVAYGYYPGPAVAQAAADRYRMLAGDQYLVGLPRAEFVAQLAEHWSELNVIHAFREGNSRSQFVFFSQLVEHAGYELDVAAFAPGASLRDEFVWARFHSQATGRSDRLATVLDRGIREASAPATLSAGIVHDRTITDPGKEAVQLARADFPKSAAARRPPMPPARPGTSTRSPAQDRTNGMGR